MAKMGEKLRKTAIDIVGDVPWGTHFCQFYETKEDLLEILVPYFKAGLTNNEFCMWVTSEPLNVEDAKGALQRKVKALGDYIKKGQIEILDYTEWYTKGGRFDADEVLRKSGEKERQALGKGFDGLRISGNSTWVEKRDWRNGTNYEAAVHSVIGKHRILAICTYCLEKLGASEIIDVVSNHEFALIKRQGTWQVIEGAVRKETMAQLRESEERFRQVAENIREVFWLYDLDTNNFVYVSGAYETIMGRTRKSLYKDPQDWIQAVHPDDRKRIERSFAKERKGEPFEDQYRIVRPDGSVRWISDRGFKVYNESGKVYRIAGVAEDITERKEAEAALSESEEKFRNLAEKSPNMIFINKGGRVVYANERCEQVMGYKREKFYSGDFDFINLIAGEHRESIKANFSRHMQGKEVPPLEYAVVTRGGKRVEAILTTKLIQYGGESAVLGIVTDISERKKAEQELRESQRQLSIRNQIAEVFLTTGDDKMYAEVLRVLLEAMESKYGIFGYIDEDETVIVPSMTRDIWDECQIPDKTIVFPREKWGGIWGRALVEKRSLFANEGLHVPEGHVAITRVLVVPILYAGQAIGLLEVANKASDYSHKDQEFLETIAGKIAPILNARLQRDREERERKQAEEALRRSEERYALAQRAADIGSWDWNILTGELTWSDTIEPLFGFKRGEFGKTYGAFLDCVHPEDRQFVIDSVDACVKGREDYAVEHRIVWPDGTVRWVSETGDVIRDEVGKAVRMLGIVQDITERKATESRQELAARILECVNQESVGIHVIHNVLTLIKEHAGCAAAGIRLREGDDFPYFVVEGFSGKFAEAENYLCTRNDAGEPILDAAGQPVLECLCGLVLSGRVDTSLPFFTEGGSFWTNSTTELLTSTSSDELQTSLRGRCNKAGYESVALIPLRSGEKIIGLLQLNDMLAGRFSEELISFFEKIATSIGIALARIADEEKVRNLAKFPSEDPYPVLRINDAGQILYSNAAGCELLEDWGCEVEGQIPEHWHQYVSRTLKSGSSEAFEVTCGDKVFSLTAAPVVDAGYVNVYGTDITERKEAETGLQEAYEESRRRSAETAALLDGARAVLENREFQDAAKSIFDICKSITGATAGYVAMLSKDRSENEVLFLDSGGRPCTVAPNLPMPIRGLRGECYRTGKAVYHNDFSSSEWAKFIPEGHASLDNVLFAPLMIEGEVVGLLGIANKPDGFTEDDARMATAFGELASVALHNSRTLESLENSEERFRSVVETANDAIVSIDGSGNIVFWNEEAKIIFGYGADEVIGKPVTLIMPERFHEAHTKGMERLVATGESRIVGRTVELAGLRKNGTEFPLELSLASWKTGEEIFFTAIIRDVTERKQAEEQVENLAKFPSESPYPVMRIARDGTVQYSNSAGEEVLKDWGCKIGGRVSEHWQQYVLRILNSGSSEVLEATCGDRVFSLTVAPIADGGYVNIYGADITERKQAEEDLRKYRQHLEELVEKRTVELTDANKQLLQEIEGRKRLEKEILDIGEREQRRIGQELHDSIGQQFTGIAFMTKVLARKLAEKSPEEAADATEIANLVNAAMDQTRGLAKGLHPFDLDAESLTSVLNELAATTEKLFAISCTFKSDGPIAINDAVAAVHLYRIAQESVNNAIKHGRAKSIVIELSSDGDKSLLKVKSDGLDFPGMQVKSKGMGLQIMDHRAEMIGGSLDIRKAPDGGTIVTCEFPNNKGLP